MSSYATFAIWSVRLLTISAVNPHRRRLRKLCSPQRATSSSSRGRAFYRDDHSLESQSTGFELPDLQNPTNRDHKLLEAGYAQLSSLQNLRQRADSRIRKNLRSTYLTRDLWLRSRLRVCDLASKLTRNSSELRGFTFTKLQKRAQKFPSLPNWSHFPLRIAYAKAAYIPEIPPDDLEDVTAVNKKWKFSIAPSAS